MTPAHANSHGADSSFWKKTIEKHRNSLFVRRAKISLDDLRIVDFNHHTVARLVRACSPIGNRECGDETSSLGARRSCGGRSSRTG